MIRYLCFAAILFSISSSVIAQQFPTCSDESYFTVEADNGVRYGWHNDASCVFQSTTTATGYPTCPDETYYTVVGENGTQYGWYNDATCVAEAVSFNLPACPNSSYYTVTGENSVDYGWFNDQSCVLATSDAVTEDPVDVELLPQSLVLSDGTTIFSESMLCFYNSFDDPNFGGQSLVILFLTDTGDFAFDVVVENPIPANPFSAVASQQEIFSFSALSDNQVYGSVLTNSELELQLDSLPSPSDLSEGDAVPLRGNISINELVLSEVEVVGLEGGNRQLQLASQSLEVNCEAQFELVSSLFD